MLNNKITDIFDFYKPFIKKYITYFIGLFIMPILWCVAETSSPYIIKIIIDELSQATNQNSDLVTNILTKATLMYISLMLIMEVSLRLCNFIWIKTIPQLKTEIRKKGIDVFQAQSFEFFTSHTLGDLVTRFRSLSYCFEQIMAQTLYGIYPNIISAAVAFLFIISINKYFAGFFFVWYLSMNTITYYFAKKSLFLSNDQALTENKLVGHVGDLFRNTVTTKTFSSNLIDQEITQRLQKDEVVKTKKLEWLTFRVDSLRSFISLLMLAFMIISLAIGWEKEWITLGDFSFITAICFYIRRSAWMASIQLFNIFKELGIISQSLEGLTKSKYKKGKNISGQKIGHILVKDLNFNYDNEKTLLKKINLEILPGEKIGISGPSGSGKTSFAHLLLGFFSSKVESIFFDGVPLSKLYEQDLCSYISYVPQQNPLFHRSIYENIKYGNADATKEEILNAAKLSNSHEFIKNLKKGYHTLVGENGIKLSGGQRQRIAIARAIIKKSPILILDEAFAALDLENESEILTNIINDEKKRTIILISHKEFSLKKMDSIFALKNGSFNKWGRGAAP